MFYVYNPNGNVVGFIDGFFVYTMNGDPVGQIHGLHVYTISGLYVGELYRDMVVDMGSGDYGNVGNCGNPGNVGNRENPGNRSAWRLGAYRDAFPQLLRWSQ